MNLSADNNKKLKILIMSAPIGSGHKMAAVALGEAFRNMENVEVVQGNVFDFLPSISGNAFLKFYETVLAVCPSLYAFSYRWSNQGGGSLWIRNLVNSLLLHLGKSFIEKVNPDVVFSTHATPTGIFSLYKQKYNSKLWLGVAITDFTVHRWLVCPGVDAYFVADEKLLEQMGGNERKFACGIPVRSVFSEHNDIMAIRKSVCDAIGWPSDAYVCLLAGGGGGMLPMDDIACHLLQNNNNKVHVIAVAGHNDALRKKLIMLQKRVLSGNKDKNVSRLAVFGFTDDLPLLMQAADIVVTKAGGVSAAECLSCGTDVLIYKPLPGQEQANTAFLEKEYGFTAVTDIRQLESYLGQAMCIPLSERLCLQQPRKELFGRPDAAQRIAELTEKLYHLNTI